MVICVFYVIAGESGSGLCAHMANTLSIEPIFPVFHLTLLSDKP